MNNNAKIRRYKELAKNIRKKILYILHKTKSPHIGSSFSCVEILVTLYYYVMSVSPKRPDNSRRDRLIFSKGHACPALYTVLFMKGFIKKDIFDSFAVNGGFLEHHPTRNIKLGIEFSSGSLGHGLSVGAGIAYAAKKDRSKYKVYVLLSDGELNEGSTWEAAMFASHYKMDNLIAIVDYNKMQALGFTKDIIEIEPLANKWESFGWYTIQCDGHSIEELLEAFNEAKSVKQKPIVIIAHTVKGKGISFMENNLLWHYRAPNEEEYKKALEEIS